MEQILTQSIHESTTDNMSDYCKIDAMNKIKEQMLDIFTCCVCFHRYNEVKPAMLRCGHSVCCECAHQIQMMGNNATGREKIKCPMCRRASKVGDGHALRSAAEIYFSLFICFEQEDGKQRVQPSAPSLTDHHDDNAIAAMMAELTVRPSAPDIHLADAPPSKSFPELTDDVNGNAHCHCMPVLTRTRYRHSTKDSCSAPHSYAIIKGRLTMTYKSMLKFIRKTSNEKMQECRWDTCYKNFDNAADCCELRYNGKPVCCLLARDDDHHGLQYFRLESGKMKYENCFDGHRICSVSSAGGRFAALIYDNNTVVVGKAIGSHDMVKQTFVFKLSRQFQPRPCDNKDSLVVVKQNGCLYVCVLSGDVIVKYTLKGDVVGKPITYTTTKARVKLAAIGEYLVVIDSTRMMPLVWNHHTERLENLRFDASCVPTGHDVIDLAAAEDKLWLMCKQRNSEKVECMQFSVK